MKFMFTKDCKLTMCQHAFGMIARGVEARSIIQAMINDEVTGVLLT